MYTIFSDLYSGGHPKTDHGLIIIKGKRNTAIKKFKKVFKINPLRTSCQCCGSDYSIYEYETLEQINEEYDDYDLKTMTIYE